ncbi:hypothetical protein SCUCBS95973_009470 [Sporothrix curviconia]|uniref:Zn(2)-C6 fungal-type domain-containing protein n=1 Tax=Sporothrix curviconia TaxID=1260050 RepID=A0ABP0CXP3_9PEZI
MQLGPYDGRKKRSRCLACAASHLKCSGQQPCVACARRSVSCTYPAPRRAGAPVIVESSWTKPLKGGSSSRSSSNSSNSSKSQMVVARARRHSPKPPSTPSSHSPSSSLASSSPTATYWLASTDATADFYLHHFYAFVQRNDFTGKAAAVQQDLQQLGRLGPATYLRDAMLAIGAMHAANTSSPQMETSLTALTAKPTTGGRRAALEYYTAAVSGLARTLATTSCNMPSDADQRDAVLWTTLFLGFYELMSESPGQGWQLHMVHGTARALRASGAASCRRGRARTFFLQARVFEVFRAIVCSDATFLTEPEWTNLLEEMWVGDGGRRAEQEGRYEGSRENGRQNSGDDHTWHPLDTLLDLIVLCTKLRFRIRGFLAQCHSRLLAEDAIAAEGRAIGDTARSLRRALERWRADYAHVGVPRSGVSRGDALTTDPSMMLGHIFCAAANAYLSGIFDYEMDQWDAIGVAVPTLAVDELQQHVDTILQYAAPALAKTNIAPILLLFPLRIAGARSRYPRQRVEVLRLLGQVGHMYAAAVYYVAHLQRLWARLDDEEAAMVRARAEAREARACGRTYIPAGMILPVIIKART